LTRRLLEVAIGDLIPAIEQPRKRFDPEPLAELAASIGTYGVLQPLLITRRAESESGPHYRIVAGERRWRAATLAGLTAVPALLIGEDERTNQEISLVENLHRADLQPLELAQAYQAILRTSGCTQDELGARLGKSRVSITNSLRLLALGYVTQQALETNRVTEGHARALLALSGAAQEAALQQVILQGLSVRQTEALTRRILAERRPRPTSSRPAELGALTDALRSIVGAPISIAGTADCGRIVLEYNSREELERLCERIGGAELADELEGSL
jgi:ParB family chromosome partitioning protein